MSIDRAARRRINLAGAALVVVLLMAAYVLVFAGFVTSDDEHLVTGRRYADSVSVDASVVSISPARNEMAVRLQFSPSGSYGSARSGRLRIPLALRVFNVTGQTEYKFARGEIMSPVDVTIGLTGGHTTDYPFDEYGAQLYFFLSRRDGKSRLGCDTTEIPTRLDLSYGVHPYDIDARDNERVSNRCFDAATARYVDVRGVQNIDLSVQRALVTKGFTLFIMGLMGALAALAAWMAYVLIKSKREIGVGVLAYLAALLFAFPAIRSVLPGTPPLGSFTDFVAFFWAEMLIAATLFFLAWKWLQRGAGAGPDD